MLRDGRVVFLANDGTQHFYSEGNTFLNMQVGPKQWGIVAAGVLETEYLVDHVFVGEDGEERFPKKTEPAYFILEEEQ